MHVASTLDKEATYAADKCGLHYSATVNVGPNAVGVVWRSVAHHHCP